MQSLVDDIIWTGDDQFSLLMLGDVLGDRGASDYLTMSLIENIQNQAKIIGNPDPIRIIASNHDLGVIGVNPGIGRYANNSSYGTAHIFHEADELEKMYKNYFEQMKLFEYNLKTKSLFTHAKMSEEVNDQKTFDNKLNIQYLKIILGYNPEQSVTDVQEFVDRANEFLLVSFGDTIHPVTLCQVNILLKKTGIN